jgi:hypothetical protein
MEEAAIKVDAVRMEPPVETEATLDLSELTLLSRVV